jgi:molybdopterin biosynthesis enzyme
MAVHATETELAVSHLVQSIYLSSGIGATTELVAAGSALENPYVYDSAARELKAMARQNLVRITDEQVLKDASEPLIGRISFTRLR